ncbi:MAG: topoisomerase IV, partial [Oscillospiraceae bacterium]|nr:topoisomerase IV [Oscillospiraceae bacterium]
IDRVAELVKSGKAREINDMRDETDLSGLKLAIELKRGTDPDKLMAKLFKLTPLCDSFACNFNILVAGSPRVMGIREILEEWTAWRIESVKRRVFCELTRKKERLHLLHGLGKILLDIDKAIEIIRNTDEEAEVVPNLMIGFGIDETQAEFVAEIKLRNINREYILKKTAETDELEKEIADLEELLGSRRRIKSVITEELREVIKRYAEPRKTEIIYDAEEPDDIDDEQGEDYPVRVFVSREGYFKKITPQSLRMSGEQKYKEGDGPRWEFDAQNRSVLLVFTDRQQVYKTRISAFEDGKASLLGTYLPVFLEMDEGESVAYVTESGGYKGDLIFFFENGKAARVQKEAYATKTKRKKLTGAYSDKSPLVAVLEIKEDTQAALFSTDGRALVFKTSQLAPKTTRNTQGVSVMSLRKRQSVASAAFLADTSIKNTARYSVRSLPAAGALLKEEDSEEKQLSLLEETE